MGVPVRGDRGEEERQGVHPGIHEHPEDRSRGSLPAAAENDDAGLSAGTPRVPVHIYGVSSRTNKKERLENCASLVSPGWKPDRKVEDGMAEFVAGGIASGRRPQGILCIEFSCCRFTRRELVMLIIQRDRNPRNAELNEL